MTTAEARVILFVGDVLSDFCKSLRSEQVGALNGVLDMSQKILLLEILSTVLPPQDDAVIRPERQEAWTQLVKAARRIEDGL